VSDLHVQDALQSGDHISFMRTEEVSMADLFTRMIRASKLDVTLYEEVEADRGAMGQAVLVVVISSVAAGIGAITVTGPAGLVLGTVTAILGWLVWAFLVYLIGTKLLPEPQTSSDPGELMRTIGFSSAPGTIRILAVVPALANIVILVASIWMLVAMVVAVRTALDYTSTPRAVGVCVIGWFIQVLLYVLVFSLFARPA
jgi:hypothetical protein